MPGCVVRIQTDRMGNNGEKVPQLWDAALVDSKAAIEAVRIASGATTDEVIEVIAVLTDAELKLLELNPGNVIPHK